MSVILLVLGILITGAGVVTIGYGISIYEPSLGNALLIAGTTMFSAGLILIGLAAAVGQLNEIARALRGPRPAARTQGRPPEPGALPAATVRVPPAPAPVPARAQQPPPPMKPKVEERVGEPASAEGGAPVSASAIERLRSSLARKPVDPQENEAAPLAPPPPEPAVPLAPIVAAKGTNGATPPAGAEAGEEPKKAPLDFLFRGKQREAPSDSFETVWPKRGQRKDDQAPAKESPKRSWPPETAAAEEEEPRQPAILKSGVVDGMAYTLYADGSIEAQLPQGTVRFGSIAELRAHIENNS
jgi:hypothetical protein